MYSFMGGGLFCAGVGNILLIVSTATDYWMQYRHSNNFMHQGLWRYCMPGKCFTHTDSIGEIYSPAEHTFKHTLVVSNLCFKLLFPRPSIPLWLHYSCIANKLVTITWPLTFWPLCVCSQHTGMLHERSWSCLCWPASLASFSVLWPSSTTLPLTGLIKPLLQAFYSSSHVSWLFFLFYI